MKTAQLHPSRVAIRVMALMAAVAMASPGCATTGQRPAASAPAAVETDCFALGGYTEREACMARMPADELAECARLRPLACTPYVQMHAAERDLATLANRIEAQARGRAPDAGSDAAWLDDLVAGLAEERSAWARYRDAHCLVEPLLDGMSRSEAADLTEACRLRLTQARIAERGALLSGSSAVATVPSRNSFQGAWSHATHCGFGHYVALDLVENEGRVTGSWSDGTNVRGSQGELKGDVRDGRLHVEWCSEGEEAGGHPQCPRYGADSDYFERRGDSLVWFRSHGAETTEYVVLQPGGQPAAPVGRCDDEQD